MATMNISLTPELVELVNAKVTSGMYHTASEVIREGLRLLQEQDEIRRIRLEQLRKEIAIGTEQLERGEATVYASGKEAAAQVKAEGRKHPEEFIKNNVIEHHPALSATGEDTLDAKLHRWQQQDGTALVPNIPTQILFAQWAEEDAHMTEAEREAEDRLWNDMEKGLAENGGLQLRHLSE